MDLFNRLLVILLDLALILVIGTVVVVVLGLVHPAHIPVAPVLSGLLTALADLEPWARVWTVVIGTVLLLLGLLLLFLEIRPGGRTAGQMVVKHDGLGVVTVAREGIRELVDREAGLVSGVMEVRSQVKEDDTGLSISCQVSVDPTVSVPSLARELQDRLKAAVEHHLGRAVARVSLDTQVAPLPSDRKAGRRVR